MNSGKIKIISYWISTTIVMLLLLGAAISYVVIHDKQEQYFINFGYPVYVMYPLAFLKVIAFLVIVTHKFNDLRDMVYASYSINMAMALVAHARYGDSFEHVVIGLICLIVSYLLGNQVRGRPQTNFFGRWTDKREL